MGPTGRAQEVVIYSKKGCHLCDVVESEVRLMGITEPYLRLFKIDEDRSLYDTYWLRVPVIRIKGRDVFEAKMMDQKGEWKKGLARLLG